MKNKKGVSLIELIVVLVIIAIGATLLVPHIGAWLPRYSLRSATRDIVSVMRTAQMRAISTNLIYQVSFTPSAPNNPGSYTLRFINAGGQLVNDGVPQVLSNRFQLNTTLAGNVATFNPNSTITNGAVNIIINPQGIQRTILLEGRRIRILD